MTHQLIGEGWYGTEMKITNSSDSVVTVSGIELVTSRGVYVEEPPRTEVYPLEVPSGATQVVTVMFSLRDGVQTTFKKTAELRVHYQAAGKDEIARAKLVPGPRDYATR